MSVRIYEISKELGLENKEVINLLQERGHKVSSASNTIDNISARSFIDEYKSQNQNGSAVATAVEEQEQAAGATPPEPPASPEPEAQSLPPGRFVKSAAEVDEERRQKAEAQKPAPPKPAPAKPEMPAARKAPPPPPPPPAGGKAPALPPRGQKPAGSPPAPPPRETGRAPAPPSREPAGKAPPASPPRAPGQPSQPSQPKPPAASRPETPKPPEAGSEPGPADGPGAPAPGGLTIIHAKPPIVVRDFANQLGLKPFRLISELMELNIFASMNQVIEEETAVKLAEKHGYLLEVRHRGETQPEAKPNKKAEKKEEPETLEPRPPVVCVLGHVDHGKTTLLDTIRKTNVVQGEAGGITQHVGAYQVEHNGQRISFIDTPGHAAFSKMRERGANVTDIAVLVVAADDGFMPQTDEALKFAQAANVALVVAVNKMDSKGANIDRVRQQMQQRGIPPEELGGEILTTGVSALKGEGMEDLLENIILQAEVLEIKANPKAAAEGVVIESQVEAGRGPTATVIVQRGTLKVGDALVCGPCHCKVRALLNDRGERLKSAGPGDPALVLGWSDAPESGETFLRVKNERQAKAEAEENAQTLRREELAAPAGAAAVPDGMNLAEWLKKGSGDQKVFRCIVKSDVHGTVEALVAALEGIKSERVRLEVLESAVGQVSQKDIQLASASEASVVAFNVKLDNGVQAQAKHHNVRIIQHNIIYELIDQVTDAMAEMLDPERVENKLGAAEVRAIFPISRGQVAGCMVTEGHLRRDQFARVLRKGETLHIGRMIQLKRFKDDATEVRAGYECGVQVDGFNSYTEGDVIECFEIREVRPSL